MYGMRFSVNTVLVTISDIECVSKNMMSNTKGQNELKQIVLLTVWCEFPSCLEKAGKHSKLQIKRKYQNTVVRGGENCYCNGISSTKLSFYSFSCSLKVDQGMIIMIIVKVCHIHNSFNRRIRK